VVEAPQGNLVTGMKWFLETTPDGCIQRHRLVGHLSSGRYQALIVEGIGNGYW
jgi:hypothetical protein